MDLPLASELEPAGFFGDMPFVWLTRKPLGKEGNVIHREAGRGGGGRGGTNGLNKNALLWENTIRTLVVVQGLQ